MRHFVACTVIVNRDRSCLGKHSPLFRHEEEESFAYHRAPQVVADWQYQIQDLLVMLLHIARSSLPVMLLSIACPGTLVGCGGGSDSSGTVIQGTLTQRGAVTHAASLASQGLILKHGDGQRIGEVKVCILGECSITDDNGQWGVNIEPFPGGDLTVTLEGHGISGSANVSLPATAKEVELDFGRTKNVISVEKLIIDGEDHTGHDHSHS